MNAAHEIYRWDTKTNNWAKLPGAALWISAAHDGGLAVVGTDRKIYVWNHATGGWDHAGDNALTISIKSGGAMLTVNTGKEIWYTPGLGK